MIAEAGAFALILALALSIAQVLLSVAGRVRRSAPLAGAGEGAALASFLAVAAAFAALMYGFVVSDFSVENVAANSHSAKPLLYRVAGTWGRKSASHVAKAGGSSSRRMRSASARHGDRKSSPDGS